MSLIKSCDHCGQKISIRQMPSGQWVAFDAHTDNPHKHGKKAKRASKSSVVDSNFARTNQSLDDQHIIDRNNEVFSLKRIPSEWLDLTPLNIKKLLNKLMEKNRSAHIGYVDRNGDGSSREIYPLSVVEGLASNRSKSKSLKIVSYCKLREDYRTFLLSSIEEIRAGEKIPQSFLTSFANLDEDEKEEILSGSNFFGSNSRHIEEMPDDYFDSDISYQEPANPVKSVYAKKIEQEVNDDIEETIVPPELTYTSNQPENSSSSEGSGWSTAIFWIILVMFAVFSCG